MKILYTTHQFFPRHIGGTEAYTLGLAQASQAAGHEVAVLTYCESPSNQATDFGCFQTEYAGIRVYEFHYNLSVAEDPLRAEFSNPFIADLFAELLDEFEPDIVHCMHLMKLSGSILPVCLRRHIPYLLTLCDYWLICPRHILLKTSGELCQGPKRATSCIKCLQDTHGFFSYSSALQAEEALVAHVEDSLATSSEFLPQQLRADISTLAERNEFLRQYALKAERIIALSPFLKDMLLSNGYPASRIQVIPHGLELETKPRIVRSREEPAHFIFVGSLVPFKGAHLILDALALIPEQQLSCTFYGATEPQTEYIKTLLARASRETRVRFAGTFPPEDFTDVLSAADALLMPAQWYENAPLVVKAARKAGLAVFASDLGSLPAEVEVGEQGSLLLPAADVSAWAEAMKEFAQQPRRGQVQLPPAIKTMRENAEEMLTIYEQLRPCTGGKSAEIIDLSKSSQRAIHLTDLVPEAIAENELGGFISVQQAIVADRTKAAIFQHPNSRLRFPPMRSLARAQLTFSIGIRQSSWEKMQDPVLFEVALASAQSPRRTIFARSLCPRLSAEDRAWQELQLSIPEDVAGELCLEFSTRVLGGENGSYCWALWGDPHVVAGDTPRRTKRIEKHKKGHVFLVTADALRQDAVSCYGSSQIQTTPHIDALATDGAVFLDAYTVSSSTPGSYTSMLTSRYSIEHGVKAEWGKAPHSIPTLPQQFSAQGYTTIMVASEDELDDPALGLVRYFDRAISALGTPTQEGAVTTRAAIRALESVSQPSFFWIQYFDTHPPSIPPEPYSRLHYQADPRAEHNRFREEAVRKIHGVESVVELEAKLPWLRAGIIDESLLVRLEATVQSLRGLGGSKPDLAIHLLALAPQARLGLSIAEFAHWLETKLLEIRKGKIPADLLNWLEMIRKELAPIEEDILTWLTGVVDLRYPIGQYFGAVSYFDSQVGELVRVLKENDLYEDATIIISSPHGELFDELGLCFHHHALRENVLRIPMVIKLPKGQQKELGVRLAGTFELVDLAPTLCEALLDTVPSSFSGRSHYQSLSQGQALPERARFAEDVYGQMQLVAEGGKVYQLAQKTHILSPQWHFRAGDTVLFDLETDPQCEINCIGQFPDIEAELQAKLQQWSEQHPPLCNEPPAEFYSSIQCPIDSEPTSSLEVSFIIANYKRLDLLKECLTSLETTVKGISYEILIVDDCSNDGSAAFIQSLQAPVRAICNEQRRGYAVNNNTAARAARGRYLCLLNNDLELTPGWFEPMLAAFTRYPQAGIVGNIQLRHASTELDHMGVVFSQRGEPENYGASKGASSIGHIPRRAYSEWPAVTAACCLIPRRLFLQVGGFDEGFSNGFEDVDLCMRLRAAGRRAYVANHSRIYHHVHASPGRFQQERENLQRFLNRWQFQAKLLSKLAPPEQYPEQRLEVLTSLRSPWRLPPKHLLQSVKGLLRYELKREVYKIFFSYPGIFPKSLRQRFGSA